ncbi:5563_t:CDS:2 [Funneliformis geosporum]|uniref:5563_t:CDS:1 n=1 Tax=Funneliformis geosporum TaxID=1117311 RepID=A0A9W4SRB6_9GLOM|nr:5563_t:CDS:2 [Funneliformis geosporum]
MSTTVTTVIANNDVDEDMIVVHQSKSELLKIQPHIVVEIIEIIRNFITNHPKYLMKFSICMQRS